MGLGIWDAAKSTLSGQLGDQWLEFFECPSISNDVLMVKGQKRLSKNSKNKNGEDNIITNGSVITVNEGQCMIIVDQGQIVEFCAQPGEFVYDSSKEPSLLLYGKLGENVGKSVNTYLRRMQFGGDTGRDQRVYYFNLKEIYDNPFGTPSPIPFRIVDPNINLDMDTTVRCHGVYTFKIVDPILFYKNVAGNQPDRYTKDLLIGHLKQAVAASLAPALAEVSALGIRYNEVSKYPKEIGDALNKQLTEEWVQKRGIAIVDVALQTPKLSEEDEAMIKELQRTAVYTNPAMAAAFEIQSKGEAWKMAASNSAGAVHGLAGLGMMGGMPGNSGSAFDVLQKTQLQNQNPSMAQAVPQQNMAFGAMAQTAPQQQVAPQQVAPQAAPVAGWACVCGKTGNTGKFCMECGAKRVEPQVGWTCSCGAVNTGKFCVECGTKKPADAPLYKCDKCGWEPEDPKNPPKFCPECGDPFDDSDIQ